MKTTSKQSPVPSTDQKSMLDYLSELKGFKLLTRDGDIGLIRDFLFDDETWAVRYVVVDTGHWLPGRKVLLSPGALCEKKEKQKPFATSAFTTNLTREQVRSSPDIDADQPVSRQHEMELHAHYGWPFYWTATGAGAGMIAGPFPGLQPGPEHPSTRKGDPHLRSFLEIQGYDVEAEDGDIGKVDDVVIDGTNWSVCYFVVNTHGWLAGRKVLLTPRCLAEPIDWQNSRVKISQTRDRVEGSPELDSTVPISREYEARLREHYEQTGSWL